MVASEEKFRQMVFNMRVGVLLQGPKAEILLSNPAALELLGLTEDQLVGRTSFDPEWKVIHEDGSTFPGNTHPVPTVLATCKPVYGVIMGVYRPALYLILRLSIQKVPNQGNPIFLILGLQIV